LATIVFFTHNNISTLDRFEYYKQDIEALAALGHEVVVCTAVWQIPLHFDAIFIWWWTHALTPVLLSRALRKPSIVTGTFNFRFPEDFHGSDYFRRPGWQKVLIKGAAKLSSLNLFVNQLEFKECTEYFRLNNTGYMPHIVDSDYLQGPSRTRKKVLFNLAWSGKQNLARKGIPELLEAVHILKSRGQSVRLYLAGMEGDGREWLLENIRRLEIEPEVQYLGYISREDKIKMLRETEIYVQPSHYEGFGLATLEAMGCGACVIVRDVGAVKEVVGDCGLYVSSSSPQELADVIETALRDDTLRGTLQHRAVERAKNFSFDGKVERLRSFWEQLGVADVRERSTKARNRNEAAQSGVKGYRVCANCVMDTSDPKITFDENGVCDHCNTFKKRVLPMWHPDERGARILEKKVDRIKRDGVGKDFDCIIGISGGVDSSYLTYVAKEKLGLRPLVFHVDGGWNSQIAVNNIEKLIDKLGLELFTEVIDWKEMRDLQLAFFKSGVPHIDLPQDHAYFATMYNFAEKHRVKYILTGGNIATESVRNPLDFFYYGTDMRHIRDIHKKFGQAPLVNFPLSGILRHKVYLRYVKGIEVFKPLDYLPYRKKDAIKVLTEKFGWQVYPRKHFESRFTKFYEGYWLPVKFGFDTRRVQYSALILAGQMTREEALAELADPPFDANTIAHDFEYVATKLGITVTELENYMKAPNRSYKDYKNQLYLFLMGARVMQLTGLDPRATKR